MNVEGEHSKELANIITKELKAPNEMLNKLQRTEGRLSDVWVAAELKGATATDKGILYIKRTHLDSEGKYYLAVLKRTRDLSDGEVQLALDAARSSGVDIFNDSTNAGNLNIDGLIKQVDKQKQDTATTAPKP